MLRVAVIVGICAATLSVPALAQSRWDTQVNDQVARAGHLLKEQGFSTGQVHRGSLREGEGEYITLTLRAGRSYALVGVCDNDCTGLDLRLFDASDNEVDSDTQSQEAPIVRVRPAETTTYRLKVVMTACKTSPCYYAVSIFGK